MGIARSSDYPEIERITPNKLRLIDELIRDKSALEQDKLNQQLQDEQKDKPEVVEVKEPEPVEDMNAIKALPPPEVNFFEEPVADEKEAEEVDNSKALVVQTEADLLNLGEDAMSSQDHADKLALALFDGGAPAGPPPGPAWEAFKDEADWESALVQSASNLNNQRPTLGGGFDRLLLDGMYQKGQTMAAMASSGYAATGSPSSVAFGSAGRPAMLALPAPSSSFNGNNNMGSSSSNVFDPFAASLAVAPPSYVQMSDMEKKQMFLVQEQMMWEQYQRDGKQGHVGMSNVQTHPYPYNQGGYWHGY